MRRRLSLTPRICTILSVALRLSASQTFTHTSHRIPTCMFVALRLIASHTPTHPPHLHDMFVALRLFASQTFTPRICMCMYVALRLIASSHHTYITSACVCLWRFVCLRRRLFHTITITPPPITHTSHLHVCVCGASYVCVADSFIHIASA